MARKKNEDPGYKPRTLKARTKNQEEIISSVMRNAITLVKGPAGTGKTHVAIGLAVRGLQNNVFERIIVTRPLVSVGKDMGYLPGGIEDKVGPYVQPCFDELAYYLSLSMIRQLVGSGTIEIVPLSMMRGRTFNNCFIILDEAQNAVETELKSLLTRIGEDSRMVLVGDTEQSDLPVGQRAYQMIWDRLTGLEGLGFVEMYPEDIVRHSLIQHIIKRLW